MKNAKSLGSDKITAEFLKLFWTNVKVFIIQYLNERYRKKNYKLHQHEWKIYWRIHPVKTFFNLCMRQLIV